MAISSLTAARHVAYYTKWKINQFSVHKILYICHMLFLGKTGEKLIKQPFEAWVFGPVEPYLYQQIEAFNFGNKNIDKEIFGLMKIDNMKMNDHMNSSLKSLSKLSSDDLAKLVYLEQGAWRYCFTPRKKNLITQHAMKNEYQYWIEQGILQ